MAARHTVTVVGLCGVLTLVIAAPAAAAPFTAGDITAGGTTWTLNDLRFDETPEIDEVTRADWLGGGDTYDSGLEPIFLPSDALDITDTDDMECAADGDLSPAGDSTADMVATCELIPFATGDGELDATYELRFFDDGVTVRSRLTVTNTGAATVTGAHVGFYENYYQDDDTRLGASTTAGDPAAADATVVDGDVQWVIYDALEEETYEVPVIFTAAGLGDSVSPPVMASNAGDGEDLQETLYPLPPLAPGESVEVVQFTVWNFFEFDVEVILPPEDVVTEATDSESTERETVEVDAGEDGLKSAFLEPAATFVPSALAAVTESWGERSRFASLSARDAAGITGGNAIVNWGVEAQPELAETGPASPVWPLAALAALLVLSGAGIAVVRQRHS